MMDDRGKYPPAKEAAAEELRRQWKIIGQLMNLETEELFIGALPVLGLTENSDGWKAAISAWREHQQTKTY
jgi:hypothetical protein